MRLYHFYRKQRKFSRRLTSNLDLVYTDYNSASRFIRSLGMTHMYFILKNFHYVESSLLLLYFP